MGRDLGRATVVLRHWFGLSVEETAHELGCATGTVKSQRLTQQRMLRSVLGKDAEPSEQMAR